MLTRSFISIFILLSTICFANAKYTVFIPSEREAVRSNFYRYNPSTPNDTNFYQLVDKTLQQHGIPFQSSDLSELESKEFIANAKYFVFCNTPLWIADWKKKLKKIPHDKRVLITFEPPAVMQDMFSSDVLDSFGTVITWDDSLIDNKKFFKFSYAVLLPMIHDIVPFSQKKLLTQISGNKTSSYSNELYSERLKCIEYFEKVKGDDFDFYGTGWQGLGYRNFRGQIADKTAVLKNYRFCVCYENTKKIKGYITEKIFDSFHAGVVPIYWGASNVKKYIPANCFIDRTDFSSNEELVKYLKSMKEDKYNQYLVNISKYLQSEQAKEFSKERFAQSVLTALNLKE